MTNLNNYYQILGVNPSHTWAEIKQAYRQLVKHHHPDLFLNNFAKQQAESKFKQINLAYEYLERHHNSVVSNTSIGKNSFRSRVNSTNPQDLYEAGAKLAENEQWTEAIANLKNNLKIDLSPLLQPVINGIAIVGNYQPHSNSITVKLQGNNTQSTTSTGGNGKIQQKLIINVFFNPTQ